MDAFGGPFKVFMRLLGLIWSLCTSTFVLQAAFRFILQLACTLHAFWIGAKNGMEFVWHVQAVNAMS